MKYIYLLNINQLIFITGGRGVCVHLKRRNKYLTVIQIYLIFQNVIKII